MMKVVGSFSYQYFGYCACPSKNSIWLGGFNNVPKNFDYPTISFSMRAQNKEYCAHSNCVCRSNLSFVNGECIGDSNDDDKTLIIVLSTVFSVVGLFIISFVLMSIILVVIIPKRKKSTKV